MAVGWAWLNHCVDNLPVPRWLNAIETRESVSSYPFYFADHPNERQTENRARGINLRVKSSLWIVNFHRYPNKKTWIDTVQ